MSRRQRRTGRSSAQFVQLHYWFQDSAAWRTLAPGPRALYVEIKRRFTGANNGRITLSHREAASLLNVHRNTIGPWFSGLVERGFIAQTRGAFLGPSGVGETAQWRITEEACDGVRPSKEFMQWKKPEIQKPHTKNRTPRHKKQDTPSQKTGREAESGSLRVVANKG